MLPPYPKFSMEALTVVADVARKVASGQAATIDRPHALRAAYALQGYGLSVWQPDEDDGGVVFGAAPAQPPDLNALADQLDKVKATLGGKKATPAALKETVASLNLDWKSVLKTLAALIISLLG